MSNTGSPSFNKVHAKLVVEVRCPSCGSRNFFFLLNPPSEGAVHRCTECRDEFPISFHLEPSGSKVAYRYLELALDKWFKEFSLIFGKLEGSQVVVDAPIERVKTTSGPMPVLKGLPPTGAPAIDDEIEEPGRLTHYRKGTGAGVDEIRELLKSDPENRQLKEWLAFALYTNDLLDDAINTYLELLEVEDTDPISHYYLANCYFKGGYPDAAKEEWNRVIELAPDSTLAKKAQDRMKNPRI